ncbi:hypothetical protein AB5S05_22005, partial [Pseudomonas sp. 25A3E]
TKAAASRLNSAENVRRCLLIRHLSHGEDFRLNRCPGSVDHYICHDPVADTATFFFVMPLPASEDSPEIQVLYWFGFMCFCGVPILLLLYNLVQPVPLPVRFNRQRQEVCVPQSDGSHWIDLIERKKLAPPPQFTDPAILEWSKPLPHDEWAKRSSELEQAIALREAELGADQVTA